MTRSEDAWQWHATLPNHDPHYDNKPEYRQETHQDGTTTIWKKHSHAL